MNKAEEKRVRERVNYIIDTLFTTEDNTLINGTVKDLSMNGFYLETEQPLPVDAQGRLKIILQLGETVKTMEAVCHVIRKEDRGMALTIDQIDQESSITLYNMIKFYLKD